MGVLDKVTEEAAELSRASDDTSGARSSATCCWSSSTSARKLGIDSEAALRARERQVRRALRLVERAAAEREVDLRSLSMEELDELWQASQGGRQQR